MNSEQHVHDDIVQIFKEDLDWGKKVTDGLFQINKSEKKPHTKLTGDEKKWIVSIFKCPDCLSGEFIKGHRGGLSLNVSCNNPRCGSRFNLTPRWIGKEILQLLYAERI
jgi:hypothetical protein